MDSMRKRRLFWLILSLVWMLLIYVLSAQPGNESAALSDRFVALLEILFFKQEALMQHASIIVRKTAHMSEYGILAILLYQMYWESKYRSKAWQHAFVCSVAYAASDEFHQLFVSGRAGMWSDVFFDACGAAFALIVWHLIKQWLIQRKSRAASV